MKNRNTKQKQMILDTLKKDHNHPTIQELFEQIVAQEEVGQATVYRNMSRMVEEGLVNKIAMSNGVDRYDADLSNHYHLVCRKCGRLMDIFDDKLPERLMKIEKDKHIQIDNTSILLEGICSDCLKKEE